MTSHIKTAGIGLMAYGGYQLLILGALTLFMGGISGLLGAIGVSAGDEEMMIMGGAYLFITAFIVVIAVIPALGTLICGWGVMQEKPWARIGGLVFSCLALISVPIGTLVGGYAIFVLIDKDVTARFAGEVA